MKKDLRKSYVIFTVLLLILLLSCIIMTAFLGIRGVRVGILGHRNDVRESAPTASLGETFDYGDHYIQGLIFVGDSVTVKLKDSGLLYGGTESLQVWSGEGGDLTLDFNIDKAMIVHPSSGSLMTVAEAAEMQKPKYMVISLGIRNGVQYCSEEGFKEYYKKLVESVKASSPGTMIILQSVFPVSKKFEKANAGITADKIKAANVWISEIADECGVRYLDTHSALCDGKGQLRAEYDSGDGLHLNTEGYKAVLHYIRTHGYK